VIHPDAVTLAEALKAHGYYTAGFIANTWVEARFGFGQGFDEYHRMKDLVPEEMGGGKMLTRAGHFNRVVFPWLEEHADEPFFLYLHSVDPHDPYAPVYPYNQLDEGYVGQIDGSLNQIRYLEAQKPQLSARDLAHLEALYDGEIKYNDYHIGLLLDKLERLGILDNTLVIVTSDHGEEFLEHGSYRHGKNLYEFMIRVPLVMRLPDKIPAGRRVSSIVQTIDMMPTILDLVGSEIPPQIQGRSLVPLINGEARAVNDIAYVERSDEDTLHVFLSAITDQHKIITYPKGYHNLYNRHGFDKELFDLRSDPGEYDNLSKKEPQLTAKFEEKLDEWLRYQEEFKFKGAKGEVPELDEETLEELRALGYIN
jgi:arylsulfatase A-like enzyme